MAKKHSKKKTSTVAKAAKVVTTVKAAAEAVEMAKEIKKEVDVAHEKITAELHPSPFRKSLAKPMRWILVVGGIIGLVCSFIISYDKLRLLQDGSFQPNCDINPIISCGSVMKSWQGSLFGFPNPWIGLIGFGILLAVGMGLFAGAKYKRWYWLGLQAGTILGLVFVHWLFSQAVYVIQALCPYCMVVWVVTITTFWYTLLYNIEQGFIKLPAKLQSAGNFARKHHLDILLFWLFIIFVLIMQHFWYFFGKPFGA